MNTIGTGTRSSKTKPTCKIFKYFTESVTIAAADWTYSSTGYYTEKQLFAPRWTLVDGFAYDWTLMRGSTDITSIVNDAEIISSLFGFARIKITLNRYSLIPTESTTFTVQYRGYDTFYVTATTNDNYHHLNLGGEQFNSCSPLLPTIDSNDVVVTLISSTSFDIRISNPLSYNVEIIGASITVDDSDQTTLTFGLSDLSETLISSEDQGTTVFSVDMDDYTGNDISGYSITLEIGGTGRQTLTFREDM